MLIYNKLKKSTKKRHPKVTQNITEYLDLSRDYQDKYIIMCYDPNVKLFE